MPPADFNNQTGFLDKLTDFLSGLGQRLAVHLFALLTALFFGSSSPLTGGGVLSGVSAGFSVYIGIICLIPRGISARAEWLLPGGCGFALMAAWALRGVPWQFACIWGGALTWIIRRAMTKAQIDWEWAALPWLLIGIYSSVNSTRALGLHLPWAEFPVLAVAGWGAVTLYGKYRGSAAQKALLLETCARLEKKAGAGGLPPLLADALIRLTGNIRHYLKLKPAMGKDSADFVNAVTRMGNRISTLGNGIGENETQKNLAAVARLEQDLNPRIRALEEQRRAESPQAAVDAALAGRMRQFHDSSRQLLEKSGALPMKVRGHVSNIALATDKILVCMREDPEDVSRADRFLARYLKAAHSVVDEYARLSSRESRSQSVIDALIRSEDLLARLQKAFEEEHSQLLRNDAINFTAELNVLDKLLKMDGK